MAPAVNTTQSYINNNITTETTITSSIWRNLSSNDSTTASSPYSATTEPNIDTGFCSYYACGYPTYVIYVVMLFLFVFLLPMALIISAMQRKKQENMRALALQRQRARRQMEINVTNNNNCSGGGSGASNLCAVIDDDPNNVTILPKTLDLPPSYDEAAYCPSKGQSLSGATSTWTVSTTLESSNPNLSVAGAVGPNEPPPVYEVGNTITTTTTTTTSMSVV